MSMSSSPGMVSSLLTMQAMPEVAQALRANRDRILERWKDVVTKSLPDADGMTREQVRNSIPNVLDHIARALEFAEAGPTEALAEVTRVHGVVRFHESYNVNELIVEYRILRRLVVEEVEKALGRDPTTREVMAIDMAVDIALQQAVAAFVEHQREQLRSASEAEAKFLSFLSHDLRNHLNGITLTLEWVSHSLQAYPDLKEEGESLRSAHQAVGRTVEGMEHLLQAERFRKKAVHAKMESVALATVVFEVLAQARHAAEAKGLRTELDVPAEARVTADRGLVGVILQNLVGNAIKYSQKGVIKVSSRRGVGGWTLDVSDEGPGIPAEQVKRLFEAFTRGENPGQYGVGLGLFIASQAAKLLKGELSVTSTEGRGSVFSLSLPGEGVEPVEAESDNVPVLPI